MAARFQNIDRETPMLLPACIQDWVPDNDLAHFVIDAVASMKLDHYSINHRGTGDAQFPPAMMLTLLIYCYATGLFGSRRIEHATYQNLSVRFICANTHPDHDTICTFRRKNDALIKETFLQTLLLARELKLLKVGTVAIDGTKIMAHASKHAANSYGKAGELITLLETEVTELLAKAETADSTPLQDGLTIQGEIVRRENRIAQLKTAREVIEARAREAAALEKAERAAALAERAAREANGEKLRGKAPAGPESVKEIPSPKDQYNYTDPDSRIMKTGSGFEQSYNAQAAVEIDSRLIVGERVSDAPNDKEQLVPTLASIPAELGKPDTALTDSGFYSEAATAAGKALYKQRQQTVEPVFGIIKSAMGFRQFLLRGKAKVSLEWSLVTLAYNMRRLHRLGMHALMAQAA